MNTGERTSSPTSIQLQSCIEVGDEVRKMLKPAPLFDNGFSLLSMHPFARDPDFDLFRKQHGCSFLSFDTQLELFLKERHLEKLESIRNLEFKPHPIVKFSDDRIEYLNQFIQDQASYILEMAVKLDLTYPARSPCP